MSNRIVLSDDQTQLFLYTSDPKLLVAGTRAVFEELGMGFDPAQIANFFDEETFRDGFENWDLKEDNSTLISVGFSTNYFDDMEEQPEYALTVLLTEPNAGLKSEFDALAQTSSPQPSAQANDGSGALDDDTDRRLNALIAKESGSGLHIPPPKAPKPFHPPKPNQ